jgi:hypothetical protein
MQNFLETLSNLFERFQQEMDAEFNVIMSDDGFFLPSEYVGDMFEVIMLINLMVNQHNQTHRKNPIIFEFENSEEAGGCFGVFFEA